PSLHEALPICHRFRTFRPRGSTSGSGASRLSGTICSNSRAAILRIGFLSNGRRDVRIVRAECAAVADRALDLLGTEHDVRRAGLTALEVLNVANDDAVVPRLLRAFNGSLDAIRREEFEIEVDLERITHREIHGHDVRAALFKGLKLRGEPSEISAERGRVRGRVREVNRPFPVRLKLRKVGSGAVV